MPKETRTKGRSARLQSKPYDRPATSNEDANTPSNTSDVGDPENRDGWLSKIKTSLVTPLTWVAQPLQWVWGNVEIQNNEQYEESVADVALASEEENPVPSSPSPSHTSSSRAKDRSKSEEPIAALDENELRARLKEVGLPTTGTKADLVFRLRAHVLCEMLDKEAEQQPPIAESPQVRTHK
jgi:hypothetical protein